MYIIWIHPSDLNPVASFTTHRGVIVSSLVRVINWILDLYEGNNRFSIKEKVLVFVPT